jgi:hypothetical protein
VTCRDIWDLTLASNRTARRESRGAGPAVPRRGSPARPLRHFGLLRALARPARRLSAANAWGEARARARRISM